MNRPSPTTPPLRPWLALVLLAAGCAAAPARAPDPALLEPLGAEPTRALPPPRHEPAPAAPTPASTCTDLDARGLQRAAVARAVDAGFGAWLGTVAVSPVKGPPGNRFLGWRIERLPDDPCYGRVDLRPGDVVTRINGATLERPEQASDLFQSLRAAGALEVALLRDGVARSFRLPIHD